jgi:hypothetical protein
VVLGFWWWFCSTLDRLRSWLGESYVRVGGAADSACYCVNSGRERSIEHGRGQENFGALVSFLAEQ